MKGLLMRPWKIKAIAESAPGFEWQTRRLSGLAEINKEPDAWKFIDCIEEHYGFTKTLDDGSIQGKLIKPRYLPGEVVYMKEAWATEMQYDDLPPRAIPHTAIIFYARDGVGEWPINVPIGRLRSPMFLMEWMAREFARILTTMPERLQIITPEDCIAEGIQLEPDFVPVHTAMLITGTTNLKDLNKELSRLQYIDKYAALWDSINPKQKWGSNPWDFRYCFIRCDREGKELGGK